MPNRCAINQKGHRLVAAINCQNQMHRYRVVLSEVCNKKNKGADQLYSNCAADLTFVFTYAKGRFSHDVAEMVMGENGYGLK